MTRASRTLLVLLALVACGCAPGPPRNVVLVVIDTMRADRLGVYGYERATSPALDRWSERGVVFERALATSPWTVPSFGSLYTGQLPSRHGAARTREGPDARGVSVGRLDRGVRTLAEILSEQGYATAAVVNNPFLHEKGGLSRGFDHYDYHPSSNARVRRADDVVARALEWIDAERAQPFFIVAHLFDPHLDYSPPTELRGVFSAADRGGLDYPVNDLPGIQRGGRAATPEARRFVADAYDEELLGVDAALETLFAGLEARSHFSDSLVIVVSDHGEELFDHGGFEHGHSMHQELLHVPLILWSPGAAPRRVPAAVSIADVAPTVLDVLGVVPEPGVFGRSLAPALRGGEVSDARVLLAENTLKGSERKALVEWPYKLVLDEAAGEVELFDLEADPGENQDVSGPRAEIRERMLTQLRDTIREARRGRAGGGEAAAEFPAEVTERLRELGYLGADAP